MKPSTLLDETRVEGHIAAGTPKEDVIRRLVTLATDGDADRARALSENLVAREKVMTTGIGRGVAVPHVRSALVEKPVAALGISREGVEWDAVDGEPVHIIVTFITPESDAALHVKILGETATLFGDEGVRREVIDAGTAAEALEIMRRHGG